MIKSISILYLLGITISLNSFVGAIPTGKLGMALPDDELVINDDSIWSGGDRPLDFEHVNNWDEDEELEDDDQIWAICGIESLDDETETSSDSNELCRRASAGGGGGRGGGGGGGGGKSSSSSSSSSSNKGSSSSNSNSGSSGSNAGAGAAGAGVGAGAGAGAAGRNNGNNNGKKNKTSDALPTKLIGIETIGIKGPMALVIMLFLGSLVSLI